MWDTLRKALPGVDDGICGMYALRGLRDGALKNVQVNMAAEVQLIYGPHLTLGRLKSSLYYKVVRCREANDLVRDAAAKFAPSEKLVTAQEAMRRQVCTTRPRETAPVPWEMAAASFSA